ncbi:hypothetical protein GE09DRAFT_1048693 [Coniochaeta sp. 2T2.1]|nr:hypothetical protein GE09DRAFT_1048693 [Coniochaeta sp. 2T2.1]
MGLRRLLSRTSKDPSNIANNYTPSISSDYSVPESVPPAYPVNGRLNHSNGNHNNNGAVIDTKPFMPDFPIMNGINNIPSSRKPVAGTQQSDSSVGGAAIPRPPSLPGPPPNGTNAAAGEREKRAYTSPPQILHPMSIHVPPTPKSRLSFFSSSSSSSSKPSTATATTPSPFSPSSNSTSTSTSKPNIDIPAHEIRRCTKLLRRMYELQLDTWSMRYALGDSDDSVLPDRLEKRRQADALLVEIQNMVGTWSATTGAGWTEEERARVEYVGRHLESLRGEGFW